MYLSETTYLMYIYTWICLNLPTWCLFIHGSIWTYLLNVCLYMDVSEPTYLMYIYTWMYLNLPTWCLFIHESIWTFLTGGLFIHHLNLPTEGLHIYTWIYVSEVWIYLLDVYLYMDVSEPFYWRSIYTWMLRSQNIVYPA